MSDKFSDLPDANSPEKSGFYLINEDIQQGEGQMVQRLNNGNNLSKVYTYKYSDRVMKPEQPRTPATLLFPNLRDKIITSDSDVDKNDSDSENFSVKQTHNLDKISENTEYEDIEFAQCLVLSAAEKIASDKIAAENAAAQKRVKAANTNDTCDDNSWFVIYGDDYQPVVLNSKQYAEFRGKLPNEECCVPAKTFLTARSKSKLQIIYDEENHFINACQLSAKDSKDQILGKSISLTCLPNDLPGPVPYQCDSQPSSGVDYNELYAQIESLKRKNDELQSKIDVINAGACCVRKPCKSEGKTDLECNTDLLTAQKKIADLQCELRDLNCEVHRLNEDRFFHEMKCSQYERRNKTLQAELDHGAKIEKELRCCLEFAEKQVEKERSKCSCCKNQLAKIYHLLQMDCKTPVEEIAQQDISDIQCSLEKLALECIKNCEYYQKSYKESQCCIKSLEQKLGCSNAKCEEMALKIKKLQDQILGYQEDLQSSVTDLSTRIHSRENELYKTQNRVQELTKRCSHHESTGKCKDFEIKHLKDQICQLEADRDQCLERLRCKKSTYKMKIGEMKDKYKHRLKSLLDKQVQVCYAKSNDSDEDKNEIAIKKMEVICSEAITRMQDIQNRIQCNTSSETDLKQRLDDLNSKLESVKGVYPLCHQPKSEKVTQTNRISPLPQLLKCPSDYYCSKPVTAKLTKPYFLPEKPSISCRLDSNACQAPDIQHEIKRAQQWATNILTQQPCGSIARQDNTIYNERAHQCPDFYQYCSKSRQRTCPFLDGSITALPIVDSSLQFRPPFLLSCPILPQNQTCPYNK